MKIRLKNIFEPCKNPLVKDFLLDRYNEYICGKDFKNCIKKGSYYGMCQAWCSRCGHKNSFANKNVPEWNLPDRYNSK